MKSRPKPIDSLNSPRFAGVSTFYRLPIVDDPAGLDVAIFGVPFDGGQSYRVGSRFAPNEIRKVSGGIKPYHPSFQLSPYDHLAIADIGDSPVNPLDPAVSREWIEGFVDRIVTAGATPVAVGGDHSITLPILRALAKKHGPLAMIQLDAHLDTADSYFGTRFGGGTPFRRAVEEGILEPNDLYQIAIRGPVYESTEFDFVNERGIHCITMDQVAENGMDWVLEQLEPLRDKPLYFTLDIDGIDPAFAPGTTAPVPGGITSLETIRLLRNLRGFNNLVGFDVVEVQPAYDIGSVTSILASLLTFEFLSVFTASRMR
jgi:agmatinase